MIHSGSAGATGTFFPVGEDGAFPVEKGNAVTNPLVGQPDDDLTGRLTDAAVDSIKREAAGDQPFLTVLAHYAVHTPLEAREDEVKKYARKLRQAGVEKGGMAKGGGRDDADLIRDRSGMTKTVQNNPTYAAVVERVDDSLGRVMAALQAAGADENTVVVFTSDHGGRSTHGLKNRRQMATSNLPLRQGKGAIFDGGLRVPLMVRRSGTTRHNEESYFPTHGVDVYPTLLELAGLPSRSEQLLDGLSFADSLLP